MIAGQNSYVEARRLDGGILVGSAGESLRVCAAAFRHPACRAIQETTRGARNQSMLTTPASHRRATNPQAREGT